MRQPKVMSERILVTGISGFIGSSLGAYFAAKGSLVVGLSRRDTLSSFRSENIRTDYETVEIAQTVKRFRPDIIIHAAGSSSIKESLENPSEDFSKSVALTQRLLEGVRISGVRPRIVFPSSAAVYGDPAQIPVAENAPLRPISPYGYHKSVCEMLVKEYALVYGIPSLVMRLFSVFGPRQKRLLMWELFDQFGSRQEVVIEGTGNEARDYIHVADLACLVGQLLSRIEEAFLVVNVATGRATTVREAAYLMKNLLNSEKPIVFQGKARPGDPLKWQADVSLYETLTKSAVNTDFSSRLQECLLKWSESK